MEIGVTFVYTNTPRIIQTLDKIQWNTIICEIVYIN